VHCKEATVKAKACWCILLLLSGATSGSAQSPVDSGSALEILEQQIQKNPPPLEPPGLPLLGPTLTALVSAGCAGLALIPTFAGWDPEEERGDYLGQGMVWGGLQGFLVNPLFALSWLEAPPCGLDLRAEYGNLLDLPEGDREQRAYQILRKRADRARQQRVVAALLTLGGTAIPAGAYYLGSALAGPNPNVRDFGVGYVAGIALGSLYGFVMILAIKSDEEAVLTELEARKNVGGGQ
jgi:hypothetical protein